MVGLLLVDELTTPKMEFGKVSGNTSLPECHSDGPKALAFSPTRSSDLLEVSVCDQELWNAIKNLAWSCGFTPSTLDEKP